MSNEQRDKIVLGKIIQYCNEAQEMLDLCGNTEIGFMANKACRYAVSMCIMQIGELTGRLSEESKIQMSVISWNMIRGMRNVLAHDYISVNWQVIWATVVNDLPALRLVCERYLNQL